MSDELTTQRYTEADRAGIFAVLREAFSEHYAHHLMRIWDWKYDSHPLNREAEQSRRANHDRLWSYINQNYPTDARDRSGVGVTMDDLNRVPDDAPYILVLKDGEQVVAMQGSLPRALLINGERHMASIGCDFAVRPTYRGRFLSMRLALRARSEHRLSIGWLNDSSWASTRSWGKSVAPILNSLKIDNPPASGRMRVVALVKPFDWPYVVQRATGIKLPAKITAWATAGAQRAKTTHANPPAMPGVDVFNLETFDDRVDDLWRRCSRKHQVIGIRDADFLNWRFSARPDASYVCLAAARGAHIVGYLIYRVVERDGGRLGYLVDFLTEGEPDAVFAFLVAYAEERMLRDGVLAIVCSIAKTPYRKVLHQSGYYPAIVGARSYLGAGVSMPDDGTKVFGELPKWFITMADGDAEMSF